MKKIRVFLNKKFINVYEKIRKDFIDKEFLYNIVEYIRPIKCLEDYKKHSNIYSYDIDELINISIIKKEDNYLYCLNEPNIEISQIKEILEAETLSKDKMFLQEKNSITTYYQEKIKSKLGPLYPLFKDSNIEEIALNSPEEPVLVFVSKPIASWIPTNIILSYNIVNRLLRNLAQMARRPLSISTPLAEGILNDGHRVALTWGQEVSRKGSSFVIRLKRKDPLSLPQLVGNGTLSPLMAAYLWLTLDMRGPGLIIGGMASGKSVAPHEKIRVYNSSHPSDFFVESFEKLWSLVEQPVKRIYNIEFKPIMKTGFNFLTLDSKGFINIGNAIYLIRHCYSGKMYQIESERGYRVSVTPDHSLLLKPDPSSRKIVVTRPSKGLIDSYIPVVEDPLATSNNVTFDKVTKINEFHYEGHVFDIEMDKTNSFEANGIFVHNTTLLQALLNSLPQWTRLVTIEDTPELQILHENWDALYTRIKIDKSGEGSEIDLYELSKFALRRRADYIVIGEIRGREAQVLAQAIATGHGSLTTFHAFDLRSALYRLTNEPISLNKDFLTSLWNITVIRPEPDGKRRVHHINEIELDEKTGRIDIIPLFRWDPKDRTFHPKTPVELLNKSRRLRMFSEEHSLTEKELVNELALRVEFLESLAKRNVATIEYRNYVREFYSETGKRW